LDFPLHVITLKAQQFIISCRKAFTNCYKSYNIASIKFTIKDLTQDDHINKFNRCMAFKLKTCKTKQSAIILHI